MLQKFYLIFLVINYNRYNVVGDECLNLKKELSNAQKDFILCATRHSIPVQVCTQCIDRYIYMKDFYNKAATICYNEFFDNDRLNVIQKVQEAVTRVWLKAFCDECFDPSKSNNKIFSKKYQNYVSCVSEGTPKKACTKCLYEYTSLNNFYISLYQETNGNVCFDWQDQMNRTRRQWGKEFKCTPHQQYHGYIFIVMVVTVICFVALFYISAYKITINQERNNHQIFLDGPSTSSLISNSNITITKSSASCAGAKPISATNHNEKLLTSNGLRSIVECNDESSSSEDDIAIQKIKIKQFKKQL